MHNAAMHDRGRNAQAATAQAPLRAQPSPPLSPGQRLENSGPHVTFEKVKPVLLPIIAFLPYINPSLAFLLVLFLTIPLYLFSNLQAVLCLLPLSTSFLLPW